MSTPAPSQSSVHWPALCAAGTFLAFLSWIIFMADTGQSSIFFMLVRQVPHGDAIGHFFLFGTLAILVNAALRWRAFGLFTVPVYSGSLLVFCIALVEEGSQYFFPNRSLDLFDGAADLLGIVILPALHRLIAAGWTRRRAGRKATGTGEADNTAPSPSSDFF